MKLAMLFFFATVVQIYAILMSLLWVILNPWTDWNILLVVFAAFLLANLNKEKIKQWT